MTYLRENINTEQNKPNPLESLQVHYEQGLQDKQKSDVIISTLGGKANMLTRAIEGGNRESETKCKQVDTQEMSVNELARLQRQKREVEIRISTVSDTCNKAREERSSTEEVMNETIRQMRAGLMEYGRVLSSLGDVGLDIPDLDLCSWDRMREVSIFVNKKTQAHMDIDLPVKSKLEDTARAREAKISELRTTERQLNTETLHKQHQLVENSGAIKREYERTLNTLNTPRSSMQDKKGTQNQLKSDIPTLTSNMSSSLPSEREGRGCAQ